MYGVVCCYKRCPQPLFISIEVAEERFLILDGFIDSVLFLIQKVLSIRIRLVQRDFTHSWRRVLLRFLLESWAKARIIDSVPSVCS